MRSPVRQCALPFSRPWTRRPATRSKTVTRRHHADFRRVLVHFEDLGVWWPMVGHALGPDLWLMAYDARGFDLGPLVAARLVGTRRFPASR